MKDGKQALYSNQLEQHRRYAGQVDMGKTDGTILAGYADPVVQ
jgi:hypothetical protein